MKIAIIAAQGLGDGLVYLTLANNYARNGLEVDYFSTILSPLATWFPQVTLKPLPREEHTVKTACQAYDRILLCQQGNYKNLAAADARYQYLPKFNHAGSHICQQIYHYCQQQGLQKIVTGNGIVLPKHLQHRCHRQRLIIHPMSADRRKDWLASKYLQLASRLQQQGYQPRFIVSPAERLQWLSLVKESCWLPEFSSLAFVACYIYQSGWMLGNDSGIGHLAANLQLPTLTLFRHPSRATLWQPQGKHSRVVSARWPVKKFELWKHLLSVTRVQAAFEQMVTDHT